MYTFNCVIDWFEMVRTVRGHKANCELRTANWRVRRAKRGFSNISIKFVRTRTRESAWPLSGSDNGDLISIGRSVYTTRPGALAHNG